MQDLHPGNILVRERSLSGSSWIAWLTQQLVQLPPKVIFLGETWSMWWLVIATQETMTELADAAALAATLCMYGNLLLQHCVYQTLRYSSWNPNFMNLDGYLGPYKEVFQPFPHQPRWAFSPCSACACVWMRAHARFCVCMCVGAFVPALVYVCVREEQLSFPQA